MSRNKKISGGESLLQSAERLLGLSVKSKNANPDASWLETLRAFVERQSLSGLPTLGAPTSTDDVVACVGQPVVLSLELDRLQALTAQAVTFLVDGESVGDAPVRSDRFAHLRRKFDRPGCFDLDFSVLGKGGAFAADPRSDQPIKLQVLDREPVVCVDAAELLRQGESNLAPCLRALAAAGCSLIYIDSGDSDRLFAVRQARSLQGLPLGAVMRAAHSQAAFERFSVDFGWLLFDLAVRRLRAAGAAVVAVVGQAPDKPPSGLADLIWFSPLKMAKPKAVDLKTRAREFHKRRQASEERPWRLAQMVGQPPVRAGNLCQIELNNKKARLALFKAIDAAKQRVDLQFYIFRESRFTHELGVALTHAARRGVQVRLIVDALWSNENFLGSWNSLLHDVKQLDNIQILAADAVRLSDSLDALKLRQRDHRKLAIIDGARAFIGGRNAADEYYYDWSEVPIADWTAAERIPWLDAHVEMRGPAVADVQHDFDKTWRRNGGAASGFKPPLSPSLGATKVHLVVHDGVADAKALALYDALIASARSHIYLVNDFPVIDDIAALLRQAIARGVRVTYLTGSVLARRLDGVFFRGGKHRELFEYVVKSRFGRLADAGVRVVEFVTPKSKSIACVGGRVKPYVHAKIVSVDGEAASVGSANLDVTASYWEREANVLLEDKNLVADLETKLERLAKAGQRLDTQSASWLREAPQRELVARLWPDSLLS